MSKILSIPNGKFIRINNVVIRIPTFTILQNSTATDVPYDIGTPTWEHFVNSSYNTDHHFLISGNTETNKYIVYCPDSTHRYIIFDSNTNIVRPASIITENGKYFLNT